MSDVIFVTRDILGHSVKRVLYQSKYFFCLRDVNQILGIPDPNSSVRDHCNSEGVIKIPAPLTTRNGVMKEQVFIGLDNLLLILVSGTLKKRLNEDTIFMVISAFIAEIIPLKRLEATSIVSFIDTLGFSGTESLDDESICNVSSKLSDDISSDMNTRSGQYRKDVLGDDTPQITHSVKGYFSSVHNAPDFTFMDFGLLRELAQVYYLEDKKQNNNVSSFNIKMLEHTPLYESVFYEKLIQYIKDNRALLLKISNGRYLSVIEKVITIV